MPNPDIIRLLLVIAAIVLFFGMFVKPFCGPTSYLIIMMTRPGLHYPALAALRIELLVGVSILIFIAISPGKLNRIKPSNDPIIKWMFVLFGVMLVSMVQAFNFKYSFDWMLEFAKVLAFIIMIVAMLEDIKDLQIFIWAFAIVTCLIGYDALYNFFQGQVVTRHGEETIEYAIASAGMGSGHVALANITLQAMPFIWYLGVANQNVRLKSLGVILFLVSLCGVIISGSRGGFVGLIAFLTFVTIFSKRKLLMIMLGVASILLMPLLSGDNYLQYMKSILDFGSAAAGISSSSRISGLRHGIEMAIRRPILGVGPGCYPLARSAWFGWGLWAHNHYGELIGDLGLIGVIVWFLFFKQYFMRAWSYVKQYSKENAIGAICLAVVVSSIVRLVVGMGSHSVYIFFWYMTAAIMVVVLRQPDAVVAQKNK